MQAGSASINKVAIASSIGTAVEWYDFFLYGTASALIFGRLFFPTFDPLTGTLASYGTFAVGFAARPIGGILCGHFGDRVDRKSMLVVAGGLSPIIATGLFAKFGSSWPIELYVIGMAAITTISVYVASETAHKDISAGPG